MDFKGRSLLSMRDLTPDEIVGMIELSRTLKLKKKKGVFDKNLADKNVAVLFEKPSTRTRCSFAVACADEGAHAEYLGRGDIHLGLKEDLRDTAGVLGRMFDLIGFRGFLQSTVEALKYYGGIPVINGLTDDEHPTQVLADLLTIYEHFGNLHKIKLCFVGDGRNNVANSLMIGSAKAGLNFTIAAPDSLAPDATLISECEGYAESSGGSVRIVNDPAEGVRGAHVIYTDVWVSMGEEEKSEERLKLLKPYQVNAELMRASGREDTIFLHDLPAVKGNEVTEEVFEGRQSLVFDQAENRMHTIKAVMVAALK